MRGNTVSDGRILNSWDVQWEGRGLAEGLGMSTGLGTLAQTHPNASNSKSSSRTETCLYQADTFRDELDIGLSRTLNLGLSSLGQSHLGLRREHTMRWVFHQPDQIQSTIIIISKKKKRDQSNVETLNKKPKVSPSPSLRLSQGIRRGRGRGCTTRGGRGKQNFQKESSITGFRDCIQEDFVGIDLNHSTHEESWCLSTSKVKEEIKDVLHELEEIQCSYPLANCVRQDELNAILGDL
ncbi:hypothetical protein ACLB2K_001455 [Fragaria x ananassa]